MRQANHSQCRNEEIEAESSYQAGTVFYVPSSFSIRASEYPGFQLVFFEGRGVKVEEVGDDSVTFSTTALNRRIVVDKKTFDGDILPGLSLENRTELGPPGSDRRQELLECNEVQSAIAAIRQGQIAPAINALDRSKAFRHRDDLLTKATVTDLFSGEEN